MHLKHALLVKKEIYKYHKGSFIEPINYSLLLFRIFPTMKLNGEIICYTNFKYLNKDYPKYNFPLPHIETIVDSIIGL